MKEDWFKVNPDDVIKRLKISLDSPDLLFIGRYESDEDKDFGFFKDVRSISGVRKYYPTNNGEPDEQLTRPVEVWSKKIIFFNKGKRRTLENGKWYKFYTTLSHQGLSRKQDNPFLLQADLSKASEILDFTGFELIENIQKDSIDTPASVKGKLTRSIEAISNEINTQPATFIFELIQNADDYPNAERAVNMSFEIKESYLIIKHNGSKFEVNNAVAICDINEGDKRGDIEKIGFKGIGFKSIFKDSDLAYISSGEYSFRFDELKWRNEGRKLFWQITPINTKQDEYENLIKPIQNVNLVIRPRELDKLSQYQITLKEHFKDERILLFLRNVKRIDFIFNEDIFFITTSENKWKIIEENGIVLNEAVKAALNRGIALNDKRIPLKFQGIEKTEISFGYKIDEKKVCFLDDATIYAYLPTKINLGFGFLINGNFIPDGLRTTLHKDILWNEFLFEKAGELFPNQLLKLINEGYDTSSVLSLWPDFIDILRTRDKDTIPFIEAFKKGFNKCIKEVKLIPSQNGGMDVVSNIVIDETGISDVIGLNFASVFETEGNLISSKIESAALIKLKKYVLELNPAFIFNIDKLYKSYKNGSLNSWLLVAENNSKFLKFLADNSVAFNKFKNEPIILGYENYDQENLKLYSANSLYISVPLEAQFIDLPVVHNYTLESISDNKLDFSLIKFDTGSFLKIVLNKIDQIKLNSEKINKAWHFLYYSREEKIDGSSLVNERFKLFPINTIDREVKNLEECSLSEKGEISEETVKIYTLVGLKDINVIDSDFILNNTNIKQSEFNKFLVTISSKIKNTDEKLLRNFINQVSKDDFRLIKSLDSSKQIELLHLIAIIDKKYSANSIKIDLKYYPIITHLNKVYPIKDCYLAIPNNLSQKITLAQKIFSGIDNINFINENYFLKTTLPVEDFANFLERQGLTSGLNLISSNEIKDKSQFINLSLLDKEYLTYNSNRPNFQTNTSFKIIRDLTKLSDKYENLKIFWNEILKKEDWDIIRPVKIGNNEIDNPFIFLLKKQNLKFFPMKDGSTARYSDVIDYTLESFVINEKYKLVFNYKPESNLIKKIKFSDQFNLAQAIDIFQNIENFEYNKVRKFLNLILKNKWEVKEFEDLKLHIKLPDLDENLKDINDLVYLDESFNNALIDIKSKNFPKHLVLEHFNYHKEYRAFIDKLKISVFKFSNVSIREVKNKNGTMISLSSSGLLEILKEFNEIKEEYVDLLSSFRLQLCNEIVVYIKEVPEIKEVLNGFIDETEKIIYFKDHINLAEVLSLKYNFSTSLLRRLRNRLEEFQFSQLSYLEKEESINTDEPATDSGFNKKYEKLGLTEDEVKQLERMLKCPLNEDEMENQSIVALYKGIGFYEGLGYDLNYSKNNTDELFRIKILKNIKRKDNTTFNAIVRSGSNGMLYLKYNAWIDLQKDNYELAILTSNKSKPFEIVKSIDELEDLSGKDAWILQFNSSEKIKDIQALFKGEMVSNISNKYNQLSILIRLPGYTDFGKIFENISFTNNFLTDKNDIQ
jgi:hypothetical protein